MSLVQGSMAAMPSVYRQPVPAAQHSSADHDSRRRHLLQAVWWVSRQWVEHLAVDDPQRMRLIHLGLLSDDIVRAGDYSATAMTAVCNILCASCRCLKAAQGACAEQSLEQCQLLNEGSS